MSYCSCQIFSICFLGYICTALRSDADPRFNSNEKVHFQILSWVKFDLSGPKAAILELSLEDFMGLWNLKGFGFDNDGKDDWNYFPEPNLFLLFFQRYSPMLTFCQGIDKHVSIIV